MKREVFFVVNENSAPKLDGEGKWTPVVEIRLRFNIYRVNQPSAVMHVDFVEKWFDNQCLDAQRCVHSERVYLDKEQDFLLAAACEGAREEIAEETAMNLFWRHAVLPSMEPGEEHWLRKHAPGYWHSIANIVLKERERECSEVQDA